jgi:hypothetical protein
MGTSGNFLQAQLHAIEKSNMKFYCISGENRPACTILKPDVQTESKCSSLDRCPIQCPVVTAEPGSSDESHLFLIVTGFCALEKFCNC